MSQYKDYCDIIKFAKLTKSLIVAPFELYSVWCNNDCDFCYLKNVMRKTPPELKTYQLLKDKAIEWFKSNAQEIASSNITINLRLIGGEIFALPEEYYEVYRELLDTYYKIGKEYGIKINVNSSTNLMYAREYVEKVAEIYDFCKQRDMTPDIIVSYDICGRFRNEEITELWYQNTKYLSQLIKDLVSTEILLTKPSINEYLEDKDTYGVRYFRKVLAEKDIFSVSFNDNYQPYNEESMWLIPTHEENVSFFKKIYDEYPTLPWFNIFKGDFNEKTYDKDSKVRRFRGCSNIVFGLEDITNNDPPVRLLKGEFVYAQPNCAMRHMFWKDDNKPSSTLIDNKPLVEHGYNCLEKFECVNAFWNNVIGCGICKYKSLCYSKNLVGCYQRQQLNYVPNKCWKKEMFKYINENHG